jgi:flagellar FliL protein
MADDNELDMGDGGDQPDSKGGAKKPTGLGALLPNLLKFVAIGVGALIFIVTVTVITVNIVSTRGTSQTTIPDNASWVGVRPQFSVFTGIGQIRTNTRDAVPSTVVVDMILGYDLNDNAAMTEINARLYELRDFTRSFFRSKTAAELQPENEARLKQEIVELLNTRVFGTARIRMIYFNQLDVMNI